MISDRSSLAHARTLFTGEKAQESPTLALKRFGAENFIRACITPMYAVRFPGGRVFIPYFFTNNA